MEQAVAVNGHVPDLAQQDPDGIRWIGFRGPTRELSYPAFEGMPDLLLYKGHHYQKMSYNSDNGWIYYKGISKEEIAREVK